MSSPPEQYPDPLTEGVHGSTARMMAVLSGAAQAAVLLMEIRERKRAGYAVTQAQRENALAAAERARAATDQVPWQRALDDDWLDSAASDELTTAWAAARLRMHDGQAHDARAHDAVQRLETTLVQREPRAMDLYRRLMDAPYPPEEAMRQAAEWFTYEPPDEPTSRRSRYAAETRAHADSADSSVAPDVPDAAECDDLRAVLSDALPAYAHQVIQDPAWPTLAALLGEAQRQGEDVRQLLDKVVTERQLVSADSIAQVLHWRVDRHLRSGDRPLSTPRTSPTRPTPPPGPATRELVDAPVGPAPTPHPTPPQSLPTHPSPPSATEPEAAEAARLARLASPEPVSGAPRQQSQTGSAVVTGKAELGRDRTQGHRSLPRPRR